MDADNPMLYMIPFITQVCGSAFEEGIYYVIVAGSNSEVETESLE